MIFLGLLLFAITYKSVADVTDGTELLMTFMTFRHADRTPIENNLEYSKNPEVFEKYVTPYGFGQLTNKGKRRAYAQGQFLRNRYSKLFGSQYDHTKVYFKSTDSTRTKMSILAAIAAIYPPVPGENWSSSINWQPVPYTTVPVKYDHLLSFMNCPTFSERFRWLGYQTSSSALGKYSVALNEISKEIGYNMTNDPYKIYIVYDFFTSQESLGLPLSDIINCHYDDLKAAAVESLNIFLGDENYIAYQAGVLLQDFYDHVDLIIKGENTQRVRIYSGHDINVFSFEAVTQIKPRLGVPKYSSVYGLELRKNIATDQIVVLPFYLPEPGENVVYPQVEGCDQLCDYKQFVAITKKNAMDIDTWRTACGFSEDLVINEADIA